MDPSGDADTCALTCVLKHSRSLQEDVNDSDCEQLLLVPGKEVPFITPVACTQFYLQVLGADPASFWMQSTVLFR